MKALLGKKLAMTQHFRDDGTVVPATLIEAGPCVITQVKTAGRDGYAAVQIGWGAVKHVPKPIAGHLKDGRPVKHLREFRVEKPEEFSRGQELSVAQFSAGETVKVTGWSKGRGFQGVVKRHHFKGAPATHGHKDDLRMPGSIGPTEPQHVFKGTRMAGRMASHRVTVRGLKVLAVDADKHQLLVSGALPGARNGFLMITAQ
ncbi:MAG: 50S ribosomal protein L3 [Candidatus Kerfeldbacteria bacterium]|nr:50S ribosomal protein L3 [Candidatus Kerfeldbacteria bacterium]